MINWVFNVQTYIGMYERQDVHYKFYYYDFLLMIVTFCYKQFNFQFFKENTYFYNESVVWFCMLNKTVYRLKNILNFIINLEGIKVLFVLIKCLNSTNNE